MHKIASTQQSAVQIVAAEGQRGRGCGWANVAETTGNGAKTKVQNVDKRTNKISFAAHRKLNAHVSVHKCCLRTCVCVCV